MSRPTILLLNPPASRPVMRDGYCSQESKGRYLWAPLELVAQSGVLGRSFDVHFIDAVAEKLGPEALLERMRYERYSGLLVMIGWVSFREDVEFIKTIRGGLQDLKVLSCGDVLRFYPGEFLKGEPALGAALVDWTSPDTVAFFSGETGPLRGIMRPGDTAAPAAPEKVSIGVPEYSGIDLKRYRMPLPGFDRAATVVTADGCPFGCDYCILEKTSHRTRELGEVASELSELKSLGVKNIFFHDGTLNMPGDRFKELLSVIGNYGRGMRFMGFFRADVLDDGDIGELERTGFSALLIGIESPDSELLGRHVRNADLSRLKQAAVKARECGVITVGHFITSMSGENSISLEEEAAFMRDCDTDFVSVNGLILRPGTTLFEEWLHGTGRGVVDLCREFSGCFPDIAGNPAGSGATARARALMRRYYFRPRTMFRMRKLLFNPRHWRAVAADAFSLAR